MGPKDLMIGDWVRTEAGVLRVAGIRHKITCTDGSGNPTHVWEVTSVEPIRLTEDILEKNGFKLKHKGGRYVLSDKDTGDNLIILWKISNAFVMVTTGMTIAIQNVHNLQHLMKLCGIDTDTFTI